MKFIFLLLIFISSTPLLANDPNYLGTNRADVEAGLRAYSEKQLADMKRKEHQEQMRPEPLFPPKSEIEDTKAESANWDDEISKLIQVEAPQPKPRHHVSAWNPRPMIETTKKVDWE